jgi:Bacterial Ig domain
MIVRNTYWKVALLLFVFAVQPLWGDACKTPDNRPPIAGDDTFNTWPPVGVATPLLVLANDRDPDGDALTVVAVGSAGAAGQTQIGSGGGSVSFTAAAGHSSARFTYTVRDARGLSSQAVVYVNTAPVTPTVTVVPTCAYRTCSFTVSANPAAGIVAYEWLIHKKSPAPSPLPAPVRWLGTKYVYVFDEVGPEYVVQVKVLYASGAVATYRNDNYTLTAETARIDFAANPDGGLYQTLRITEANYLFKDAVYTMNWGDGSPTSSWGGTQAYFDAKPPTDPLWQWYHAYSNPGTYDVTITVTPSGSNVPPSRSTHAIIVPNNPPVPSATWTLLQPSSSSSHKATFDPTATVDDYDHIASAKTYSWTFSDGRIFTTRSSAGNGGKLELYFTGGTYTLTFQATDHHGSSATRTYEIVVPNTAPAPSFRFDCSEGLRCKLDARDTVDIDRNIKEYRWKTYEREWTTSEPVSEMLYVVYGRHPIELTVIDDAGASTTTSRIMHVRQPHQGQRLAFYSVPPCRLYDSQVAASPLLTGTRRTVPVAGQCGVPATAVAVEANLTVDGPAGAGHLMAWAGGAAVPDTTVLNFAAGEAIANNAAVPLGGGALDLMAYIAGPTSSSTRVIVDVAGFWAPATVVASGTVRGPSYLFTDNCPQEATWAQSGAPYQVPAGGCGYAGTTSSPADAVLVQSEAWQPGARGHVTVFPYGAALPAVSSYNIPGSNRHMTGLAFVRTASNGVYEGLSWQYTTGTSGTNIKITSTILGSFLRPAPPEPSPFLPEMMEYVPIASCRVFDSRLPLEYGNGPTLNRPWILIGGNCGMRRNVAGVRLNVTLVNASTQGSVLFPGGQRLWTVPGATTAYGMITRVVNSDGYGSLPSALYLNMEGAAGAPLTTGYIVDVTGYFLEKNRP